MSTPQAAKGGTAPSKPPTAAGAEMSNGLATLFRNDEAMPEAKRKRSAPGSHAEGARRGLADDDRGRLEKMGDACTTLLECLGEDVHREGLLKTPKRMAEALLYCTRGYSQTLSSIVNEAVFDEDHHEMILVKDIEVHSLCEHHMVPFTGKVHIAYIPRSKVRRCVHVFARVWAVNRVTWCLTAARVWATRKTVR